MSFDYSKLDKVKKASFYRSNYERQKKKDESNSSLLFPLFNNSSDIKINPTVDTENKDDNIGYIARKTGSGIVNGTVGIAQGQLTEVSNNLQQGAGMSNEETAYNVAKAIIGNNPIFKLIDTVNNLKNANNNENKNENQSTFQKIINGTLNGVSNAKNNLQLLPGLQSTEKLIGKAIPQAGDKVLKLNDKISEPINQMNKGLAEERNNYNDFTKFLGDVGQSVGNMVPSIAGTYVTKDPSVGLTMMGLSVKGQATQEALDNGKSLEDAIKIGDAKALIEVATEKIAGGTKVFGKGSIDDIAEDLIKNKAKSKFGKFLLKQVYNTTGEIAEEELSNVLNNILDKGTTDPEKEIFNWQEFLDTALQTAATTNVLNAFGGYKQDYRQAKQETLEQTNKDLNNNFKNNDNEFEKVQSNQKIEQDNLQRQQSILQNDKTAQNQTSEQINDLMNNKVSPLPKLQYQETDNEFVNNMYKSAVENNFNNSQKTHDFLKPLEQIIRDKNLQIRFDTNLKDSNGNIANGSYSNGVITINPNSTRAGEFIAIHELTHAIGTKEMLSIVNNYRQSNAEFDSAVNKLLQNYNETEITEEAMADVAGQLFGNQEFINNLAQSNPNIFKKLYNEIKYLWHQFAGYKNQNQFIKDLQYKWEQAYRSNAKLNDMTSYSKETDNKFGNYWQVEDSKDIFKGITKTKDLQNKAYKYLLNGNDNFEYITDKIDNKQVKFARISAQEYVYGRNSKTLNNEQYNQKMRTAPSIDDLINNADITYHSPLTHKSSLFKEGFNNYQGKVGIDNNIFQYIVRVGKTQNDNLFYDLSLEYLGNKNGTEVKVPSVNNTSLIKNSVPNNSIPSSNTDVNTNNKYSIQESKNNTSWQQFLEDNFKANGTRTNLKEIHLPTAADIERIENNAKQNNETKAELPKTKQELLDNNSKALNEYIKQKNEAIREIDSQVNEYYGKLNSMKDKNSVEANKIKANITKLVNRSYDIEALYNKRIDNTIAKGQKLLNTPDMSGRKAVIQKNRELARERIENIAKWKDKSNGIKYQRETMERNMFDIIPDKKEAQKIVDTYFEPVHESEANKQRFINKYNDKIRELDLNKYESEAVQLFGEQKYNPDFKSDDVKPVLDRVNENIEKGRIDRTKVNNAIETFRSIYDELFDMENQALKENGYPEKPYRKGYFPHFIDAEPITKTEKILNKLGFKIDKRPLPTDIAGITEQFVPGKTWNRSALQRKTDTTTYNALKGFDTYISQAADNIFHTENIQKLRALENEIRYQYSEKGVQDRIDEIYNNDTLNQDEQQAAIERIFEQVENPMPNLVTELRRYTNALANKKSEADRSAEQKYGRQLYSTVNAIENRFGANAVGLNIGSAITNFIPITQAYSQVSTKNMGRAIIDTIKSYISDDGFVDNSNFLTNRLNQSEKLYKTGLEKISDKTSFLFNAIDSVASNIVVRGKYLQNIQDGMSVQEAIKNADRFGANLMADRSKGAMPTLFNEKSPLTKAFTQFQLEVNNQYSYMFKDMPRDLKDKGIASLTLAFFKMFIAAFFYNKASEEIVGRKSAFSPIDIATDSYKTLSEENTSTADKVLNVGKDIAEELPFVGGFLGGGRIPVSGALPDGENTFKAVTGLVTGEMDSKKALNTLGKELSKPAYYLLPPFGGGQLKKTAEGISTVANGGSYGVDSKGNDILQFPVENANAGDYIKAGLFGKYALDNAKEYANRGYKSLNAKQTQMYKEANVPYKELLDYIDQKLTKKEDKISYIEGQTLNENQKWGIYKYDILSNTERKDGGSQLSDAEYMINNGMTKQEYIDMYNKAQKNNIDIPTEKEYKELKDNGININNYMDYKSKSKQYKKDKDKIQVLINSNYSNKEIKSLYESEIKNKNDTAYDVISKSGIDIKEYLKYKQQEFESDKTDDGTTTGKTVSGSKKKKVYDYVNNMKISYNQKLLLLGMQYNLTSAEKTKLANYVNNMSITKQEKLDIYEKLSGFTVYKNGRVTW